MGMCESCPNRAMVNLNRSLGNELEAKRVEQVGCNWWWGVEYEHVVNGKPSGLKETRYECGIIHVGAMIKDQGARVEEACQSIQSNRNEIANIRAGLIRTLEIGFASLARLSIEPLQVAVNGEACILPQQASPKDESLLLPE